MVFFWHIFSFFSEFVIIWNVWVTREDSHQDIYKTLMLPKEARCSQMPNKTKGLGRLWMNTVLLAFQLALGQLLLQSPAQVLGSTNGHYLREQKHSTFQERPDLVISLFSLTLYLNQNIFKR